MLEFCIECDVFEAVFLISPQLNSEVILGCNFLNENKMQLHVGTGRLVYVCNGQTRSPWFDIPGNLSNQEVAAPAAADHGRNNTVREIRREVSASVAESPSQQINRSNTDRIQHTSNQQWKRDEQEMHFTTQR
jgi:hypothetical protein